jgi:carbonic anhydrase/acetyltransferase-like protein (isoleucine patch superfamily)
LNYKTYKPNIEPSAFIAKNATVIGQVTIGKTSSVWFGTVIRGDVNHIVIEEGSNIQDNTTVHVADNAPTYIGRYVTIGHNCIIHGCHIGDESLIGMGSTILDGAVIGEHSIVGANSLVTMGKVFEPGVLIMGSPAKVVRVLTTEEIKDLRVHAKKYVDLAMDYKNA